MSAEVKKEIELEIAHVLFLDIVGYSKLSVNEQHGRVDELNGIVRLSEQFQKAEAANRILKIPTGDGMALVFYKSPEEPAQCAFEISRALKDKQRLQVRMGIHSGPVSGMVDVNERTNVAGGGINMAQRVMDCGDAGHILLSTWFFCALAERDPAAAERALVALGDNPWLSNESPIILSHSFGEGLLARMTKDEARARTAFEAARAQQEKIVQAQPHYGPALCVLGLIDAALGRKDLALDEGRRAIGLTPLEKDVINGSRVLQYFAITAAWAGEKELALQQLEAGLRAPVASVMLSYGALKLFPVWDPLRGDPRFEKIVASLAPKQ